MQIDFHGESCLNIRAKNLTILTDPPAGGKSAKFETDVILESVLTDRTDFSAVLKPGSEPKVFARPGEYEVRGVSFSGIEIQPNEDEPGVYHTIFQMKIEEMSVCYLGTLGVPPDVDIWEETGTFDILIVPAADRLPAKSISEMIGLLRPKIVIPTFVSAASDVEQFAAAVGLKDPEIASTLKVTPKELGDKTRVVGVVA
jgi:L-ascorbate metabolism protein UlaG (beta-lactamase superfamily)